MSDDKLYVDAGEVRKVRDDCVDKVENKKFWGGITADEREGYRKVAKTLTTLLTTATPLAPEPRYAALRDEVVRRVKEMERDISPEMCLSKPWKRACNYYSVRLTAALDAAPPVEPTIPYYVLNNFIIDYDALETDEAANFQVKLMECIRPYYSKDQPKPCERCGKEPSRTHFRTLCGPCYMEEWHKLNDAAPGDAPATFPEGIPIQVDAELYYRFKGYRENDMVGEPEETFTIYVTPESSFAPPPSPTVPPRLRPGDRENMCKGCGMYADECVCQPAATEPEPMTDEDANRCAVIQTSDGPIYLIPDDLLVKYVVEPAANVIRARFRERGKKPGTVIVEPFTEILDSKLATAPVTPTVEERAAFIVREILRLPDWSPSPQWFAEVLAGERDSIVTAWLASQEQGKGVE